MCGDATNPEDIARLMGDDHARILFTSPPYSDIRTYKGCDISPSHIAEFIPQMKRYVDVMCVNLGIKRKDFEIIQFWDTYIAKARESGMKLLAWNVWDKTFPGSIYQQQAMFPLRHEFVFVFGEKAYKLNRTIPKRSPCSANAVRPMRTRRQTDGSMVVTSARPKPEEPNKPLESVLAVASERGPIRSKHPAVMPVGLPAEYIKAMTNEGDYVLEPFAGSGTTLIACEQTGRRCLAMEISEEYCEVIKERYERERLHCE
ncbi:MAG: site-specific DNA-methyltransferase [Synergistaceae bacterium]|nr:site-specific DNA-methyltransferase [Synergistaceae bacterium]MBQ3759111.1 site-specific DNA-methyltransferase [Synergistaceae bacterium]